MVSSSNEEVIGAYLNPHLEEYLAARLFHDSLYPQETPTPQTEQAAAESVASPELVAKGAHGRDVR